MQKGTKEIDSAEIGEAVLRELKATDQVAYIRFASVYREFADLEDLRREVEGLATPGDGRPVGRNGEDGGSSTEP
jgi:transcriptional repressor NrdR